MCQKCGLSVSSTELLQRHQQTAHSAADSVEALPDIAEDEGQ